MFRRVAYYPEPLHSLCIMKLAGSKLPSNISLRANKNWLTLFLSFDNLYYFIYLLFIERCKHLTSQCDPHINSGSV